MQVVTECDSQGRTGADATDDFGRYSKIELFDHAGEIINTYVFDKFVGLWDPASKPSISEAGWREFIDQTIAVEPREPGLNPCPFCQSNDVAVEHMTGKAFAYCRKCLVRGPLRPGTGEEEQFRIVAGQWNRIRVVPNNGVVRCEWTRGGEPEFDQNVFKTGCGKLFIAVSGFITSSLRGFRYCQYCGSPIKLDDVAR